MQAEIKSLHSPDIDDLKNYQPEIEDNFCVFLEPLIGITGKDGDDIFGLTICTPQWLIDNHKKSDILFVRHYMIVFEYNYENIFNKILRMVNSCSGNDWNEIALKISRMAHWEFEDYKEK